MFQVQLVTIELSKHESWCNRYDSVAIETESHHSSLKDFFTTVTLTKVSLSTEKQRDQSIGGALEVLTTVSLSTVNQGTVATLTKGSLSTVKRRERGSGEGFETLTTGSLSTVTRGMTLAQTKGSPSTVTQREKGGGGVVWW